MRFSLSSIHALLRASTDDFAQDLDASEENRENDISGAPC